MNNPSFQLLIPRRASHCIHGKELLLPGTDYFSLLDEDEEGAVVRRDYCPACWKILSAQDQKMASLSHWKSTIPLKKTTSELPKQRDARALCLLKDVLSSVDGNPSEAFMLALYLARRRCIYLRNEYQSNNKSMQLYEVAETEEMVAIPKIALSSIEISKLQAELAKKFSM